MGVFQRVPPARSDMCDSWPNNQGKKKKKRQGRVGLKEKKRGGGQGGAVSKQKLALRISLPFEMFENGTFGS